MLLRGRSYEATGEHVTHTRCDSSLLYFHAEVIIKILNSWHSIGAAKSEGTPPANLVGVPHQHILSVQLLSMKVSIEPALRLLPGLFTPDWLLRRLRGLHTGRLIQQLLASFGCGAWEMWPVCTETHQECQVFMKFGQYRKK